MIRLAQPSSLGRIERFALDTLVDLARLLPVEDPAADVVVVHHVERAVEPTLQELATGAWGLEIADGRVGLSRPLLRVVGALVGADEEQRTAAADRFERVPSDENPLVAAGLARNPIASRLAVELRRAVIAAAGARPTAFLQPWPEGRRWAAALSHDLDVVEWWGVFTALRAAELARKGQWRLLGRVAGALPSALVSNPVSAATERLIATERNAGIRSTWFVLFGSPSPASARHGDLTYRPGAPRLRRILAAVRAAGHEVGLHGSFATFRSAPAFSEQRLRLQQATSSAVEGVRQHYLRMRPGATQRAMRASGFLYDATFGFPDANGFRIGVADVVPHWDSELGAAADFDRVPLVWMDRALSKYQGIEDPDRWIDDAVELAELCAGVEGLWVGLWHPNLATALGYPGAEEAYARLVSELGRANPWIAPLADIVRWRRHRRATRARGVDSAGRPIWNGSGTSSPPPLEDAGGVPFSWS